MSVYVIVGIDYDEEEYSVLGVTLTDDDAEEFLRFYKTGVIAAGFAEYATYEIEKHEVVVFEDTVSYTRKDTTR